VTNKMGVFLVICILFFFQSGEAEALRRLQQIRRSQSFHTQTRPIPDIPTGPLKSADGTISVAPPSTLTEFEALGKMFGDDWLSQVRHSGVLSLPNDTLPHKDDQPDGVVSLVEVSSKVTAKTQKVQAFCEICILVMQMKERSQPYLCAGLNDNYYITCVEVLISLLRADKALVYWLKNGCMHMDISGPEIVRPCPALNICSWVPNLFSQPPSILKDGVEAMCPKDNKFLPTIPQEYKDLVAGGKGGGDAPAGGDG